MKMKLIAVAVGAALSVPAVAMADVSVYGRAHVSVDYLDDGAKYSETNLSSNSSRLGFKGDHEINPDLKAFFQIEQQINFTTGSSSGGTSFATRDTFVGLSGNFGAVQAGRFDSPFKVARGPFNLFGDQVGDMNNLARVTSGRLDERYDNTIQYTTPDLNGFNVKAAYSMYQGQSLNITDSAANNEDSDAFSVSLNYLGGPLEASLAYEQVEEDTLRGEADSIRAAAAYKLTETFKLVGFYQTTDFTGVDDTTSAQRDAGTFNVFGLGGEFAIAKNTALKATWMTNDSDTRNADATMWVVGVEHKLDKAVRVYANYAVVDNDENVAYSPWMQSRTATPSGQSIDENDVNRAAGEKAAGLTVGLRYDF
ncbi:Outer membrane protein (porin) [Pseudomonas cuatrocienegasensis]|uniref:Outer membrane protein (Porin) n=1 Tax=Pseudomonas cuatrocienegasensis TaxID=543360 RepID=A0ABY1AZW2_9PSED|nr:MULTISPECIES: porin [Pseudomonas]OEC36201.1 porin [Pseudomonas sp. 21C1]SEP60262.1 Outer membrane protein (porin) [Pseudomonas cuatrocienegasensis]